MNDIKFLAKNLEKESEYYISESVSVQKLEFWKHFGTTITDYNREVIKSGTGIKIKTGEVRKSDNSAVVCFDVDCKENPKEGIKLMKLLAERIPSIKETKVEQTKSKGYHVFFRVPFDNVREKMAKVIFSGCKEIEVPPLGKQLEIELLMNSAVTVFPTITKEGKYIKFGKIDIIKKLEEKEFKSILNVIADIFTEIKILKTQNTINPDKDVKIDDYEVKEAIRILEKNEIRWKLKNGKVNVFSKEDKSENGDYILNPKKMLWSIKTYKKIYIKDFIKKQNGEYKEVEIEWKKRKRK